MTIRTYPDEYSAAKDWARAYRRLGEKREFAAFIYSAVIGGAKEYYCGRTYPGMEGIGPIRANVVLPFIRLYLIENLLERLLRGAVPEAFIHTHPKPPSGFTMRQHSSEDLALLRLPGIKSVYVVPFENDELNRAGRD